MPIGMNWMILEDRNYEHSSGGLLEMVSLPKTTALATMHFGLKHCLHQRRTILKFRQVVAMMEPVQAVVLSMVLRFLLPKTLTLKTNLCT
ncbi:hypothetical protein C8255_06120 [filamentous cyanobacterium CCP3]|nr:hypothetical protein C8255_06120 [filamentous cyanobacterium CCP3]